MFKNLREGQKKMNYHNQNRKQRRYSQIQSQRMRGRDVSYSYYHQARKTMVLSALDFHIVENQHYIYQGEWLNCQKNGEGIAFMKNGTLIVGHWIKDKLNGRAIIFNPYGSVLSVEYIDNKLNGWAIAQFSNKVIIANRYFDDKVDGHRIIYEGSDELWVLSNTTNLGQFVEIRFAQRGTRTKLPKFIKQQRLTQFEQFEQLFEQIVVKKDFGFNFTKIKSIQLIPQIKYFGYLDEQHLPDGLGVTFSYSECFMGIYQKGFLNQFGRMIFRNGDIYHGQIYQGVFINSGIYYNCKKNNTIVIQTSQDAISNITEQKKGYYHIDFKVKIGERGIKQDQIKLSSSTENIVKVLQNYYRQYCIQIRKKQEEFFSIYAQKEITPLKLNQIDQSNQIISIPKRKSTHPPKQWIKSKNDIGYSQAGSQQFQPSKSQLLALKPPKISPQKQHSNQFFSINIKQNEVASENEKHAKQNPKINTYKQSQFISQDLLSPKNLNPKQITFIKPNTDTYSQSKNQQISRSHTSHIFDDDAISYQSKIPVIEIHEALSDQSSGNISNIQQKLTGIMKKTGERRKIFQ